MRPRKANGLLTALYCGLINIHFRKLKNLARMNRISYFKMGERAGVRDDIFLPTDLFPF